MNSSIMKITISNESFEVEENIAYNSNCCEINMTSSSDVVSFKSEICDETLGCRILEDITLSLFGC